MGLALHAYHDANHTLPPGYTASGAYVNGTTDTSPGWAWGTYILPYLEQGNLFNQFNLNLPVQNVPAAQTVVTAFLCPSDVMRPTRLPAGHRRRTGIRSAWPRHPAMRLAAAGV